MRCRDGPGPNKRKVAIAFASSGATGSDGPANETPGSRPNQRRGPCRWKRSRSLGRSSLTSAHVAGSEEDRQRGVTAAFFVRTSRGDAARGVLEIEQRCAGILKPSEPGQSDRKSHLADERFHDPRIPRRTAAMATKRNLATTQLTGSEQADRSRTRHRPDACRVNAIVGPLVTASLLCQGCNRPAPAGPTRAKVT